MLLGVPPLFSVILNGSLKQTIIRYSRFLTIESGIAQERDKSNSEKTIIDATQQ